MSTGAVVAFTPNQPTRQIAATSTSGMVSFNPCDAILVYNAGTVLAFTQLQQGGTTTVATTAAGQPIPPGGSVLIGTPGVIGIDSKPITQMAAITAASTTTLYVTPGSGTQH